MGKVIYFDRPTREEIRTRPLYRIPKQLRELACNWGSLTDGTDGKDLSHLMTDEEMDLKEEMISQLYNEAEMMEAMFEAVGIELKTKKEIEAEQRESERADRRWKRESLKALKPYLNQRKTAYEKDPVGGVVKQVEKDNHNGKATVPLSN